MTESLNVGGYAQVSADGSFSLDGAVNKAIDELEANAPQFVKQLEAGILAGSLAYGSVVSTVAAAAATIGVDAAAAAALSAAVPVVGIAVAVVVGLLTAYGASSGPGCCGDAPMTDETARLLVMGPFQQGSAFPSTAQLAQMKRLQRFGSCDPSEFAWGASTGLQNAPGGAYKAPSSPAELYVSNVIRAHYEAGTDCWHVFPRDGFGQALALAVAMWNATHSPSSKAVIRRRVNVPTQTTWQGKLQPVTYGAQDDEPISWAMQLSAPASAPHNAEMTVTVNTGPVVQPGATHITLGSVKLPAPPPPALHLAPVKLGQGAAHVLASAPKASAPSSSAPAAMVAVGGAALLFLLLRR